MIRRWLCWTLGHGPWSVWVCVWHEGELRRGRLCCFCRDHIELGPEIDG